ncbi:MAG: stage III sporulation protein AA [Clostridia bacterium]|nr:stage III sporulation protein AA [Clostridia bacterium]
MKTPQFESALSYLPERIKRALIFLPDNLKPRVQEIRIRAGLPVALTVGGRTLFVRCSGEPCEELLSDLIRAEKGEIEEIFLGLCNKSVYAHLGEIKEGYLVMPYGNRAGICGTFTESGNLRDVSSVNIRIACQIKGCAEELAKEFTGKGLLIAGPPGSGKTTILRDLVRIISRGNGGKCRRIAVIDSRGELSGSSMGLSFNDLGENTDILMIKNKAQGIEMAVRTLFPEVIAFDEIGTAGELQGVMQSFNAGVGVITTAHIGAAEDLMRRSVTRELLLSGAIEKIAILSSGKLGEIKILHTKDAIAGVNT